MGARKAATKPVDVTLKTDEPRPAPAAFAGAVPNRAVKGGEDAAELASKSDALARARAREEDGSSVRRRDDDPLDPMNRRAYELGAPTAVGQPAPQQHIAVEASRDAGGAPEVRARASLEELLPALVRRIAWAGNGAKGSVRMELGRGALAGATVLVHAEQGRVRVEVSAPGDADASEWRRRIDARLRERGLDVESVEVS
jgi:hypothetical protein